MLRTTRKSAFNDMKKMFYHSFLRLGVVALLCMASAIKAAAEEGVTLTLKSGQEVSFVFSSKPCIATSDAELVITTANGQKLSYDYAEVRYICFGKSTSTDITETTAQQCTEVTFKVNSGMLSVYNLPVGESVSIYNLNGQRIAHESQATDGGTLNLPLKASGVLVVRTSTGISYRILNK